MKKGLLALVAFIFLSSCAEKVDNCECKRNLDLAVNYQENAATTYEGAFDKKNYKLCLDQFRALREIGSDEELLISAVYRHYLDACVE
jgi:hypothetical protein